MSAQITESPDQQALARTLSTVDRLGLRDNLVELDENHKFKHKSNIHDNLVEFDEYHADKFIEYYHSS